MTKKPPPIQSIYCPTCHAPLMARGTLSLSDADTKLVADRYDCTGPVTHTVLVLLKFD